MVRSILPAVCAILMGLSVACGSDGGFWWNPDSGGVPDTASSDTILAKPDIFGEMEPMDPGIHPEAALEILPEVALEPDTTGLNGLTCIEFYRLCVSQCPVDAENLPREDCFEVCRQTLSTGGEATLDTFLGCLESSGCDALPDDGDKFSCYVSKCDDAYFDCFHGDDDCQTILECIQACPQGDGNGACVVLCTQDGEKDAQKHLVTILQCIGENCCPGDGAACQTPQGQQCSKDVFQLGGACFGLGTACVLGTY